MAKLVLQPGAARGTHLGLWDRVHPYAAALGTLMWVAGCSTGSGKPGHTPEPAPLSDASVPVASRDEGANGRGQPAGKGPSGSTDGAPAPDRTHDDPGSEPPSPAAGDDTNTAAEPEMDKSQTDAGAAENASTPEPVAVDETNPELFFGPPRCEALGSWLCEDFESNSVGTPPDMNRWQLLLGEGSELTIDDSHAARGSQALKVTVSEARQWAYLRTQEVLPAAAQRLWGRLFFRIGAARPQDEPLVHWNLVEAEGEGQPLKLFRYGGISNPALGRNHFLWNHEMRPRPAGFNELGQDDDRNIQVPPETWVCMEWMFDADADESRLFWDGVERPALHIQGEARGVEFDMPPLRALNLGWAIYQPILAEYVVWIDEIALDSTRIGCAR